MEFSALAFPTRGGRRRFLSMAAPATWLRPPCLGHIGASPSRRAGSSNGQTRRPCGRAAGTSGGLGSSWMRASSAQRLASAGQGRGPHPPAPRARRVQRSALPAARPRGDTRSTLPIPAHPGSTAAPQLGQEVFARGPTRAAGHHPRRAASGRRYRLPVGRHGRNGGRRDGGLAPGPSRRAMSAIASSFGFCPTCRRSGRPRSWRTCAGAAWAITVPGRLELAKQGRVTLAQHQAASCP
jgi:hypothetical protein